MLLKQGEKATMFHAGTNSFYEVTVDRTTSIAEVMAAQDPASISGGKFMPPSEEHEVINKNPRHANAAADYTRLAVQYGMKPEWLGRSFVFGRSKGLRIVGLLPGKHKNNVLVEGDKGGKYIMPPYQVIDAFSGADR